MTEQDEAGKKAEVPQPISRREFTKGSMAVLGAYTSFAQEAPPPLPEAAKALKLEIPKHIRQLMDERHIIEEDLRLVIEHGERTGLKLYKPGTETYLSKLRIQEALFYVEYASDKGTYVIETAYSHRFTLEGE